MEPILTWYTFNSETHWISNDGRIQAITNMTDSHLSNTIAFLRRRYENDDMKVIVASRAFKTMLQEQDRRMSKDVDLRINYLESRDW